MLAKAFAAYARERKKQDHWPAVPMLDAEPIKSSRGVVPKFRMTRGEIIRLELSRRSRMTPEAREVRNELIPLR